MTTKLVQTLYQGCTTDSRFQAKILAAQLPDTFDFPAGVHELLPLFILLLDTSDRDLSILSLTLILIGDFIFS